MWMKNEYLTIVDLEATCWDNKQFQRENSEIIEIGAILLKLNKDSYLDIIKEFDIFVKPVKHPVLSDYCKKLTSISQSEVDRGMPLSEAFELLKKEMFFSDNTILFGSWGKYDFNFIIEQCKENGIEIPFNVNKVVNLKSLVASIKKWPKRGLGINTALKELKMEFEGTPHRGFDDVKNIRRILLEVKEELRL
jgi:inhibitor of KinA sporulation pathway (predicted exonuclease)